MIHADVGVAEADEPSIGRSGDLAGDGKDTTLGRQALDNLTAGRLCIRVFDMEVILRRVPLLPAPFFVGGGLWGWGMARITGTVPASPAAITGAATVGGTALLLQVPVHMSQALPVAASPLGYHILFAVVLTIEVSLVAGVATWRTTRCIPILVNETKLGLFTATAAAAGFLAASLLAFPLGWEVRVGNGQGMMLALHLGLAMSATTAGAYLGHRVFEAVRSDQSRVHRPAQLLDR